MGCGGSAHRTTLIEKVSEKDGLGDSVADDTMMKPLTKASEQRPTTPSTTNGDLETTSLASTGDGPKSPTKPRPDHARPEAVKTFLPEPEKDGAQAPDVAESTAVEPVGDLGLASPRTDESVPDPEPPNQPAEPSEGLARQLILQAAESGSDKKTEEKPIVSAPSVPQSTNADARASDKEAEGIADPMDPALQKQVAKLEKLEQEVSAQIGSAGPMQKRAWRNKRSELAEAFEGLNANPDLRKRLEAVAALLEGTQPPAPENAAATAG